MCKPEAILPISAHPGPSSWFISKLCQVGSVGWTEPSPVVSLVLVPMGNYRACQLLLSWVTHPISSSFKAGSPPALPTMGWLWTCRSLEWASTWSRWSLGPWTSLPSSCPLPPWASLAAGSPRGCVCWSLEPWSWPTSSYPAVRTSPSYLHFNFHYGTISQTDIIGYHSFEEGLVDNAASVYVCIIYCVECSKPPSDLHSVISLSVLCVQICRLWGPHWLYWERAVCPPPSPVSTSTLESSTQLSSGKGLLYTSWLLY